MANRTVIAALVALAACGPLPERTATPAPAEERGPVSGAAGPNTMQCVLRMAGELGYTPAHGGAADGFVRVEQIYPTRLGTDNRTEQVTATVADGVVRIVASWHRQAQRDARALLAACAATAA